MLGYKNKTIATIINWGTVFTFLIAIYIPLVGLFFKWDHGTLEETRKLAKSPSSPTNIQAIRDFRHSFDKYFNDHFGFRKFFIRNFNAFYYNFFKV